MLNVCSLGDAVRMLLDEFSPRRIESERVSLDSAAGRIAAEDVVSDVDVPAFDRSTVDGYAVCAADTYSCSESLPVPLTLCGRVDMGDMPEFAISAGLCAYVPTGGAIPHGADAVVMLEYVETAGELVLVQKPAAHGQNIARRGEDIARGAVVIEKGRRIFPRDVGALAAAGAAAVSVVRRLAIGVISTGDELVPPSASPSFAQVRDTNGALIAALAKELNCDTISFGIIEDDVIALTDAITRASRECDVIIMSGGSSAGDRDAAAKAVSRAGKLLFHGIAVKPGKPTLAGSVGGAPLICLPGHPLAAFFMFRLVAEPLICALMGTKAHRAKCRAKLSATIPSNGGREEYVPVMLSGGEARPILTRSGAISVLCSANGYVAVPRDKEGAAKGEIVEVVLL